MVGLFSLYSWIDVYFTNRKTNSFAYQKSSAVKIDSVKPSLEKKNHSLPNYI